MCHCLQLQDRVNLVCTKCRYSRKAFRNPIEQKERCPRCKSLLSDIGSKITIPSKKDVKAWDKLTEMIAKNKWFPTCQC